MVIVIMGNVESGRNRVGRLLAEHLGWEFSDLDSLHHGTLSRRPLDNAGCTPRVEALFSAIDSLNYEWRDVIVSSSILDEKDQNLHYHHPLVKFVHLKAAEAKHDSLSSDQALGVAKSGAAMKGYVASELYDQVLTLDSSQRVEQILSTVLSELILK
jgi:gluconate kinase